MGSVNTQVQSVGTFSLVKNNKLPLSPATPIAAEQLWNVRALVWLQLQLSACQVNQLASSHPEQTTQGYLTFNLISLIICIISKLTVGKQRYSKLKWFDCSSLPTGKVCIVLTSIIYVLKWVTAACIWYLAQQSNDSNPYKSNDNKTVFSHCGIFIVVSAKKTSQ